jgi:Ca2+-binding EF-hand superfamily protein
MRDDAFVYYDQNKNGFIEVNEFKDLQPKAFFDFADRNDDGALSESEYRGVSIAISPNP